MQLRSAKMSDAADVVALYKRVAQTPGGLARLEAEVDEEYVTGFLSRSLKDGLSIVAESEDHVIVGEIHAYTNGLFCFSHVLSELTIAVDPNTQGQGVGRKLFEELMAIVEDQRPEILRVELIARESNTRAISFYKTLGFVQEGEFSRRIKNLDGSFESDIPMAWVRG